MESYNYSTWNVRVQPKKVEKYDIFVIPILFIRYYWFYRTTVAAPRDDEKCSFRFL